VEDGMTMFRRIDHIEVTPADFDRSLAFYTDVLGFAVRKRITVDVLPIRDIVFLELGDTVLELLGVEGAADLPPDGPRIGYRRDQGPRWAFHRAPAVVRRQTARVNTPADEWSTRGRVPRQVA
jgi:catechol 2,3-dioxygenase-like lactoylglutathione lyase family enzyme